MRILADENVPGRVVSALRAEGHDVLAVGEELRGADDGAVLGRAFAEGRIIVTFDKDFGELAFRSSPNARVGVILVRMSPTTPLRDNARLLRALSSRDDWAGHFSVIEDDRIRMRPLSPLSRDER